MKFEHEVHFGKDRYHQLEEMQSWCKSNIGPGGYLTRDHCVWSIETMFGNSFFRFKNEKDRNWFALRWYEDSE